MASRLSGPQKAAILLLSLGEEAASEVMKNLTEDEIREVTRHMSRVNDVTPGDVERVANEYYRVAERRHFVPGPPETKVAYMKKVLNKALGEEKSAELVDGLIQERPDSALERLKWHDPTTIAEFLADEHPQVIAVILAYLGEPALAQSIIAALPEAMQDDVYARLARVKDVPDDLLQEIEASLHEEMYGAPAQGDGEGQESAPAVGRVADLLNHAEGETESQIMGRIEHQDPELAGQIRKQMFPFEDFIKIDNYGIQKVLQRASGDDLLRALKTADEPLRRHFLRNMSADYAERIQAELGRMGPLKLGDIEESQRRLATIARELAEQGELFILGRQRG